MASVDLKKGGRVDLQKAVPGLTKIGVGLGWKENKFSTGGEYDLDVTAFILNNDANGDPKCVQAENMVFYGSECRTLDDKTPFRDTGKYPKKGKPCSAKLELIHSGDNTTGSGEGDDETLLGDVPGLLAVGDEVSFIVTIHEAVERKQNFGQISNAYVRVYDLSTGADICRYNLEEDFSTETAVQVGSLYKNSEGHLSFKAVGQGYSAGLSDFCDGYGIGH